MKSLIAGVLIVIVALASILSCCQAEEDRRDEYYELMDLLNTAVKRGSKRFGRVRCIINKDNSHDCKRGHRCMSLAGGPCRQSSKDCRCQLHDDISWLL